VTDLDTLIAEFILASERGDAHDPAEWLARHPEHASDLAAFLADLGRFGSFLGLSQCPDLEVTTDLSRAGPRAGDAEDGERFGRYELLGELGHGGMGTVHRARLTGTSLIVALKEVRLTGSGAFTAEQFRSEIETAAGLRHPNIVPVYHVGEQEGRPFYTMALVEGGSLDRHLSRFVGHPKSASMLVAKIARAVHHAHQRRVLHRDLKPANILLDEGGEPHVADFGLAARLDESGAVAGTGAAGSLPWMAPEAVRGDTALTTGADVWALGVILYELLTGQRPFRGQTWSVLRDTILNSEPTSPRTIDPRVPWDLDAICRKCLAKDPDKRYESASAVALDLERWLRDEPVRARPAGRGERFARWCRRNPGLAAGTAISFALLVAATSAALALAREQDARSREAVCRGNEYAARGIAGTVLWRLGELGDAVSATAADHALKDAVSRQDWDAVRTMLAQRQRTPIASDPDRPAFVTVFLLDPQGTIRAEFPRGTVEGKNFQGRDYFHRTLGYADRTGRDAVHVSRVFESENDGLDKLALAVPLRPVGPGSPVWVLGATITTDSSLGLESLHDGRRQTILLAARDRNPPHAPPPAAPSAPEYVVLVHRGYEPGQRSVPFRSGVLRPATAGPGEPELQLPGRGASFAPDDAFSDPLAETRPEYGGKWLAGSAPVGNTELMVLVEERYEDAVAPQQWFFRRFLVWAIGLAAAGLVAFAALRLIRRSGRFETGV
jgi:hypothetical protein